MKALSRKPDMARELFGSNQSGLQVCSDLDYACAAVSSRCLRLPSLLLFKVHSACTSLTCFCSNAKLEVDLWLHDSD